MLLPQALHFLLLCYPQRRVFAPKGCEHPKRSTACLLGSGGVSASNKEGLYWILNQINMIINYFNTLVTVHSLKKYASQRGWSPGWSSSGSACAPRGFLAPSPDVDKEVKEWPDTLQDKEMARELFDKLNRDLICPLKIVFRL
jgi:hypothetical protein